MSQKFTPPTNCSESLFFLEVYDFLVFYLWSFALSSRNLRSPITKCGAADELIKDYTVLFSHGTLDYSVGLRSEFHRLVTIWFDCVTIDYSSCICSLM